MFYIPFIGKKTTRKQRRISRFCRFPKHEFSLLGPSQFQMLLLEICVSNMFNIVQSSVPAPSPKFACTAGARGFRETVATSSNM